MVYGNATKTGNRVEMNKYLGIGTYRYSYKFLGIFFSNCRVRAGASKDAPG